MESTKTINDIDWNDVIKKEARGSGDEDLGELQETGQNYVLVQRGMINKEKFYIPKDQVESYDGDVLRFKVYIKTSNAISDRRRHNRYNYDILL